MSPSPRVSVCIVTYNHASYIEQALLSALTQRTRFAYEVTVADDASTDGTLDVIRRVAKEYPQLKVIAHSSNVGVKENYLSVHNAATGEYVAHLDGDDFWLPGKLQSQVAFLDAHPECVLAWHPLITFDEAGEHFIVGGYSQLVRSILGKDYIDLPDAITAYGFTGFHSSLMYRRSARTLFSYSASRFLIDYRLSLSLLESGPACHMRRPLGCYRAFHDQSATRGGTDFVGPGLLLTLQEYASTHPQLKPKIAAHCVTQVWSRTRFQARLIKLLASRLARAAGSAKSQKPTAIFHNNITAKNRLIGQKQYFLNTLRFARFALSQGTPPNWRDAARGIRLVREISRTRKPKSGFFRKKYGVTLTLNGSRHHAG